MSETVQIPSLKHDGTIPAYVARPAGRSEEHTSELQSQ